MSKAVGAGIEDYQERYSIDSRVTKPTYSAGGQPLFTAQDLADAVKAEREECAAIANVVLNHKGEFDPYRHGYRDAAMAIEKRIRARSNTAINDEVRGLKPRPDGSFEWHPRYEPAPLADSRIELNQCLYVKEHGFDGILYCGEKNGHEGQHKDAYGNDKGNWYLLPVDEAPTIRPLSHLRAEEKCPATDTHSVAVGNSIYGINLDCVPYRYAEGEQDTEFAAPVAEYIKGESWKAESVTVWYSKLMNSVCFDHTEGGYRETLCFHLGTAMWQRPEKSLVPDEDI
jgi:hypothetical protein